MRRRLRAAALGLVALLAGGLAVAVLGGSSPPVASRSAAGTVPQTLADGSPPGPVPRAIAAAVAEPVVGARRLAALPPSAQDCLVPWWDGYVAQTPRWSPDRPILARFERLAEGLGPPGVWVGPDGLSAVRLGPLASAPGRPDVLLAGCTARWSDGGWRAEFGTFEHGTAVLSGWSHLDLAPARHTVVAEAPAGTAWALVDRGGWWLAYDLAGSARLADVVAAPYDEDGGGEPERRVLFLGADGRPLADRVLVREPAGGGVAVVLDIGALDDVREALRSAPLRRCDEASGACVWLVARGDGFAALSAAGSHPLSTPPFGEVSWCPSPAGFSAAYLGSRFTPEGAYVLGPEPRGLDRYAVEVVDGRVRVDLATWTAGPPRPPGFLGEAPPGCHAVDGPIAVPGPVADELLGLVARTGRPQSTTWRSPSGGLVLEVQADADGLTVQATTTAALPLLD